LVEVNIKAPKLINAIHSKDWRAPIMAYLKGYHEYHEPETKEEEKRMQQRARGYRIINDELYKTCITTPLLKCVASSEGKQLLMEIHEGSCGSHNRPRALVGKAFRQGFYYQQQSMRQPRYCSIAKVANSQQHTQTD
jgi:hypothetical protein